jgi:glycosyltransferase involved in cell wall biosynthesis
MRSTALETDSSEGRSVPDQAPEARRVLHAITGLNVGGAEYMLARFLARLDRHAYASSVLSMLKPGPVAPKIEATGAAVTSLGMSGSTLMPRHVLRLSSLVKATAPDLLHGWMYHGNVAASLAVLVGRRRTPVIWSIHHSLDDIRNEKLKTRLVIRGLAKLSSHTAAISYCSRISADQHEAIGFDPARRAVIPNGIDVEGFTIRPALRGKLRALLGVGPERFVVGNVARCHPMKDQVNLVRAIGLLAGQGLDVHGVFIGHGHENGAVEGAARELGITDRITILGVRGDVVDLLPGMDAFAQSSAWGEAFPLSLGEAMACGVPSVATDVGDTAWLLGREGHVVPPRNSEALASALGAIYQMNSDARAALGERARQRVVENFSLRLYVDRHVDLYERALAHRRNDPTER